jgi:Zn ribbon nucleic-acid-binding protein
MKTGGCPKCGGDIYLDRTENPPVMTCLQCGHQQNIGLAEAAALITERNAHGYTDGGRPVKKGKTLYGRSPAKEQEHDR